jgi:two-component system, sensor histidine kinase and response regulator
MKTVYKNNIIAEEVSNSDLVLSHELRGAFNTIIGSTNLILNRDITEIDDITETINIINSTALRNYELLENLLYLSKLKEEYYFVKSHSVELNSIIEDVLSLFRNQIILKRIDVNLFYDKDSSLLVDENIIALITRNLIFNAIKFSHEGGEIKIHTVRNTDFLDIIVIDNGLGMSPNKVTNILQESNYGSTNGTFGESGTGLGLKLCKAYIVKLKGDLIISSELGKGSKFVIRFPI